MTDSDRKARREAMLAMGRDGRGNAHEQEIAMRQANKLMAEFGIAEAEADMSAIDADAMEFGASSIRPDGKPLGKRAYKSRPIWVGILCVGVARFTDTVVDSRMTEHGYAIRFRGERGDAEFAAWLFGVLVGAIQREQKASLWKGRSDANTFRCAAAGTLQDRLKALAAERRQIYAESTSRALVVVDRKRALVIARYGEQRTGRADYGRGESGARMAGTSAGQRINIPSGRPIGGTGNAPRLK